MLAAESLIVALPRHHRLATAQRISLSALSDDRFILFPRESVPQFYDIVINFCREARFAPQVRDEVDHPDLALRLVAAGLGISLVPASARKIRRRGVIYRPLQPSRSVLETAVAWRRGNTSPRVKALVDVAR